MHPGAALASQGPAGYRGPFVETRVSECPVIRRCREGVAEGSSGMTTRQQDTPAPPKPKQTPFERFLALPGVQHAKTYPRGYWMLCPVHHDNEESLMFWEDEGVNVIIGCRTFCSASCRIILSPLLGN